MSNDALRPKRQLFGPMAALNPQGAQEIPGAEQAQTNCQEGAEVGMPPDLWAMKRRMDPLMWQQVLKHRAISMVDQEMAARRAAAAEVEKKVGAGVGPHVAEMLERLGPLEDSRPMSPVSAKIQNQHVQLDELGETLEKLVDRLRPVLDVATTGWSERANAVQAAAPLLEDLQTVSGRLAAFQERLQQVLERLVL